MYTGNNLDNYDKGKLILMLQVRQVRGGGSKYALVRQNTTSVGDFVANL